MSLIQSAHMFGHDRFTYLKDTIASFDERLRDREGGKINCGTAHFHALAVGENPAVLGKFKDLDWVLDRAGSLA